MRLVIARVPLIPMSQSLSLRERAASARPAICSPSRRVWNASRIPPVVIVCIQARLTGQLRLRELVEILEDQLAFAPGVAGVDDGIDVFAMEKFLQLIVALLRIRDRF